MKATDLMIGDWVYCRIDRPVQVVGLTTDSIETTDKEGYFYEDYFEPIHLTPEILEKNGFSKPIDAGDGTLCGANYPPYILTFQSIYGLPILTIEDVVDTDPNHTCLVIKDEIYYVHQLQHALRLCGIEKEIQL